MILSGDYEFLSPFWDNISQSAKVFHICFCFFFIIYLLGEKNVDHSNVSL